MLETPLEKIGYIIARAREFGVKVGAQDVGPNHQPDPDDADFRDILEDYAGDPTAEELRNAIDGLFEDERAELVALFWIGRGDYEPADWAEARSVAMRHQRGRRTARYLMGSPLLAGHLEEGLVRLGYDLEDVEE